ncbi:hypothetical protein [Pedobacter soli]|uniref:ATP synthase F0 sector subunit C n=1 Tax=Pedobacter soli TaxID=390242 RepID=A0A1G6VSU1_9SPHI|nr:hypothetical protein [Pedobacter soli]SDD56648.1 hypothetical protein SAMN04488024_106244 [Pedobacter soli]
METKKALKFTLAIVAIIVGVTLFKQFDFKNLKFEQPALAVVYAITFVGTVYFLFKGERRK